MDLIPRQQKQGNPVNSEMSLKSRGISIDKEESQLTFLLNKWVVFSFCAVALSLAVFGGIKVYDYFLQKDIINLDKQITDAQGQESEDVVSKVTETEKAIATVKNLSKNHVFSSLFFEKIEQVTLPQVRWGSYAVNTEQGTADLRGQADSYSYLAKQIVSFQDAKITINVSGISLQGDGVAFSASIKFDPAILQKQ
jgi:hypothetical protein